MGPKIKDRKKPVLNAIEELQEEKKELESSQEYQKILLINVDEIHELTMKDGVEMHNRISYSKEKLIDLAFNIEELSKEGGGILSTGVLQPVTLRRKNNRLERIIGDNRIKAIKMNKSSKMVPAMIFDDVSDELARFMRSSENLNREDLNAYDFVLSVLEHIYIACGFTNVDEVKRFIMKIKNQKAGKANFTEDDKIKYDQVVKIFEKVPNVDAITFVDKLSVLNMHDKVKQAIVDRYIEYSHAREINKSLKQDESKIDKILEFLKSNKLSVAALKKHISGMLESEISEPIQQSVVVQLKNSHKLSGLTELSYSKLSSEKQAEVKKYVEDIENIQQNIKNILETL